MQQFAIRLGFRCKGQGDGTEGRDQGRTSLILHAQRQIEHAERRRAQKDADRGAGNVQLENRDQADADRGNVECCQVFQVAKGKFQRGQPAIHPAECQHPDHPPGQFHDQQCPGVLEPQCQCHADNCGCDSADDVDHGYLLEGQASLQVGGRDGRQCTHEQPGRHHPEIGCEAILIEEGLDIRRPEYDGGKEYDREEQGESEYGIGMPAAEVGALDQRFIQAVAGNGLGDRQRDQDKAVYAEIRRVEQARQHDQRNHAAGKAEPATHGAPCGRLSS